MTDPRDDQLAAAARDVRRRVDEQAQASGGWTEDARAGEPDSPAWASELIRQYEEARPDVRGCPHLQAAPVQPALWVTQVPDLLSCVGRGCEQVLVSTLEERLGHTLEEEPGRCSVCGTVGPVRGVSVGVQDVLIRGLLCAACESREGPSGVNTG